MTDSTRVFDPGFRVVDATGALVSGAKIKFFDATTTNTRTVYSDYGLSSSLGSVVYCNSDGAPVASQGSSTKVLIYTGTTDYKVVITTSADATLFTFDSIKGALDTSTFLTTSSTSTLSMPNITKSADYTIVSGDRGKVINANPTGGNIALTLTSATTLGDGWNVKIRHSGTANTITLSGGTFAYAGTTSSTYTMAVGETVEISCDASGFNIANAIYFPILPPPQGYLTLTSATPIIVSDVTAATAVYYTPFVGNLIPIWNGVRFMPTVFTEMTLSLSSSHSASSIYDVFAFSDSGTLRLVTGPVWSTSTAGSGARGTGAGTTQLTRADGFWVNAVSMTGRNGSTTYSVGAGYGTYLGSICMDGTNGQVTCSRTYGQSRKWSTWNAYNKQEIYLKAGDATASWTYNSATVRQSNAATTNVYVFCGLAEDIINLTFTQRALATSAGSNGPSSCSIGIGWNSTTAVSGKAGYLRSTNVAASACDAGADMVASFLQVPTIGLNAAYALESAPNNSSSQTFYGTETYMLLAARWRG